MLKDSLMRKMSCSTIYESLCLELFKFCSSLNWYWLRTFNSHTHDLYRFTAKQQLTSSIHDFFPFFVKMETF